MSNPRPDELRQRVNLFMSKLSDRDTEAMAFAELESIARGLSADALPPFVSAVGDTRPTDKTPLRRHSLRLLSLIAHSIPSSSLAPHLPRILSAALRRLRDPDSSVRAALVDAVRSLSVASPPSVLVPVILRPLADALLHEQDLNAQSVSAYSLSAALDETDGGGGGRELSGYVHRLLPRLVKLVRSPAFKAKAGLLTLMGSAVAAGGIEGDAGVLKAVVCCLVEFLGGEEWAARKAAAEALARVGVAERESLAGLRNSCLASFDARRYDKVKIVRDSINRMVEVWKEIPDGELDAAELKPGSVKENGSDGRFPLSSINSSSVVQTSSTLVGRRSRQLTSRSPPPNASPITSSAKKVMRPSSDLKPNSGLSGRMSQGKNSDWRIEISVPDAGIKEKVGKNGEQGRADGNGINGRSRLEARRVLFEKNFEGKKMDGLKSGGKVVPFPENGSLEVTGENGDELIVEQKDSDLSLIRMQLVQIEKQQSSLLELLQKFIGSSQNGINSLEARVNSLEMTLDDISHDLIVSSSRASNGGPAAKTCCRLPGTEFLSSKFWRRTDSRYASRFLPDINDFGNRDGHNVYQWNKQKFGFTNPLAEINPCSRGSVQFIPKRLQENETSDTGSKHVQDG